MKQNYQTENKPTQNNQEFQKEWTEYIYDLAIDADSSNSFRSRGYPKKNENRKSDCSR